MKVRRIAQYIAEGLIALSIFFLVLQYIPQQDSPKVQLAEEQMSFVFHAAAGNWDMFFAENELDEILSGDLKEEMIAFLDKEFKIVWETKKWTGNVVVSADSFHDCIIPWNHKIISHGASVLAYKQREDVPSFCNVERRICRDGILEWSFDSPSCKEHVKYNYYKKDVVSYNTKPINLFVQPSELATNRDAEFSMNGKRNELLIPIDVRNNDIHDELQNEPWNIGQKTIIYTNCISPWGEAVKHNQFIKAYKTRDGFENSFCEVELRLCVDGNLEGTFQFPYCEHHEMAIEDFLIGKKESDKRPTALQFIENLFDSL